MTNKDDALWQTYAQTVKAVKPKARKPQLVAPVAEKNAARKAAQTMPRKVPVAVAAPMLTVDRLERKREQALRQGDVEIEAKLDLHGMNQAEAFEALAVFMERKAKAGKRHLLIITGKGRQGGGVLRNQLRNWLAQLPQASALMAIRPAAPQHGGEGAFYVLLRKRAKPVASR